MVRMAFVVGMMLLVAVGLTAAATEESDGAKVTSAKAVDFTGKVFVVSVREPFRGAFIQKARIQQIGKREFLVGDSISQELEASIPTATYWFPIDDVQLIREYMSLEDAMKEYAAARKLNKQE